MCYYERNFIMNSKELEQKLSSYCEVNEDKVETLLDISNSYTEKDINKSYAFLQQAIESSTKIPLNQELSLKILQQEKKVVALVDDSNLPKLYLEIGAQYISSLPETALFCFNKGLQISKELNNLESQADLHNNSGIIHFHRSNFEEATHSFDSALQIYILQNDKAGMSKSHNNLGTILCRRGNYSEGLKHFISAMKIFEEIGNKPGMAYCSNNIGNIYYEQKNLSNALEYYQRTYDLFEEMGDKKGLAMSLNNLGSIYNDNGDIKEALDLFERSLALKEEINDTLGISNSYANIGDTLKSLGKFTEAREYFTKSLKIKFELEDKSGIALTYNNLSELEFLLKNYTEAEKYAHLCLDIAKEIGTLLLQRFSYEQLYQIREVAQDFAGALKWHKLYKELSDKLSSEEKSKQLTELQAEYDNERKEKETEIYRLKNIELAQANKDIQDKNDELNRTSEHLELINKILRHDLTNNLSVLRSCFRIYERNKDEAILTEGAKYVEKSFKLINKMRNQEKLSRESNTQVVDLTEFMKQFIDHYPQIKFKVQQGVVFYANNALNSVIDNLISNAINHGKSSEISVTFKEDNEVHHLRIADNGEGVPDEVKSKIFEEGFKYGKTGNSGIGLYIVKRCMESIGGSVSVGDNKPKGAEFILTF